MIHSGNNGNPRAKQCSKIIYEEPKGERESEREETYGWYYILKTPLYAHQIFETMMI